MMKLVRARLQLGRAAVEATIHSDGVHFPVVLRPGASDATVLSETFVDRYHLPPIPPHEVRRALDLGANIGLTMAHLAILCPAASVVGIEMDEENAAIARKNTSLWADRCQVLVAAVWYEDCLLRYEIAEGEESGAALSAEGSRVTRGRSLTSLLDELSWPRVDFVKMDVEGAEREILRKNTQWAARVRSIKVEAHAPYTGEECEVDLRRLGFATTLNDGRPGAVSGMRAV